MFSETLMADTSQDSKNLAIIVTLPSASAERLRKLGKEDEPEADTLARVASKLLELVAGGAMVIPTASVKSLQKQTDIDLSNIANLVKVIEKGLSRHGDSLCFEVVIDGAHEQPLRELAERSSTDLVTMLVNGFHVYLRQHYYAQYADSREIVFTNAQYRKLQEIAGKEKVGPEDVVEGLVKVMEPA